MEFNDHLRFALRRYVFDGLRPGHFLTAVAENNLFSAIGRADEHSLSCLPDLVKLFYCRLPRQCHGSPEKVEHWVSMPTEERQMIIKNFESDLAYL